MPAATLSDLRATLDAVETAMSVLTEAPDGALSYLDKNTNSTTRCWAVSLPR